MDARRIWGMMLQGWLDVNLGCTRGKENIKLEGFKIKKSRVKTVS